MPLDDLTANGARTLTVCNACRYCEQYCPVFPAMEERTTFARADLTYLANLCHNCGECLYACQYSPPHEFGIEVPRTLARIRFASYEHYAWPRPFARVFRAHSLVTAALLVGVFTGLMVLLEQLNGAPVSPMRADDNFYAFIPHGTMVALFGSVFVFAMLAIGIGVVRFVRDASGGSHGGPEGLQPQPLWRALRDGMTLRHLHGSGADCVTSEESRHPFRRRSHHLVLWGFLLCFASTSVAAVYHVVFGWVAPYPYTSLPVLLGLIGGLVLQAGCVGLWFEHARRDPALGDPAQAGFDRSFIALLFVAAFTGSIVLVARGSAPALALHLGSVLALFVTLPYGKFVHGFYRLAALWVYERERT